MVSLSFRDRHAEVVDRWATGDALKFADNPELRLRFRTEKGRSPHPGELEAMVAEQAAEIRQAPDRLAEGLRRSVPKIDQLLRQWSIQLIVVDPSLPGLVLADHPVLRGKRDQGLFGFNEAGAVGDADTILVPIRRHLAACYCPSWMRDVTIKTKHGLDWINSLLVRGAVSEVICHPSDALPTSRLIANLGWFRPADSTAPPSAKSAHRPGLVRPASRRNSAGSAQSRRSLISPTLPDPQLRPWGDQNYAAHTARGVTCPLCRWTSVTCKHPMSSRPGSPMSRDQIPTDLVRIALGRVEGNLFERFFNDFYAAISGVEFVPLGGHKDGGADGYEGTIFESSAGGETYYQASVEVDTEGKVRRTVARLREFGREPTRLVYVTSQTVRYIDTVEQRLGEELGLALTIRDGNYIASQINDGPRAQAAFDQHLRHLTEFLKKVAATNLIGPSRHVRSPAVYTFLANEMERRSGHEELVDAMTDALALWALEGTDPEANVLRTSDEALALIVDELPSVRDLVAPRLRRRLEHLSTKDHDGARLVRWHTKEDAFCLPFETRTVLEQENTADETLRIEMESSLAERAEECRTGGVGPAGLRDAVAVALRALQLSFETEGLEFASFLQQKPGAASYPTIADGIRSAVQEAQIGGNRAAVIGDLAFRILQGVLYDSREVERRYLQRLSRTYALLFTLNTEPRLIEFFQDMAGDFYLYVGSDVLVRALSEHFLAPGDQMTANCLKVAVRQGATLVLTGPVLDEVVGHMRASDAEYRNHLSGLDQHVTYELARDVPHIMLRAYLYARLNDSLGARKPKSWQGFVHHFCDYEDLRRPAAYEAFRRYLAVAFGLEFRSTDELEALSKATEVKKLTSALLADKRDDERLARNDALMALAVFGHRRKRRETVSVSEFGYQTWWLTSETSIVRHTKELVAERGGRYIMRPDFLLNFLALSPRAAEARQAFASVFPSLLGIKLARRMDATSFHKVMDRVAEAEGMDDARRAAAISKIVDQLKSDLGKQFIVAAHEPQIDNVARLLNDEE